MCVISYREPGLPLLLPLRPDPLLLGPLGATLLLRDETRSAVIWDKHNHRSWSRRTHDSVDEGDEILLLFLPLDEVSLDQRLQLRQILLLTLPVDVLRAEKGVRTARLRH